MPKNLTPQIITAAILGFEEQRRHIDSQIGELRAMLDGRSAQPAGTAEATRKRRKISAAARRRMALGQQKRWAIKSLAKSPSLVTPEPSKPKRKLSAAGRRAIIAATKKRWAAVKAAQANETKGRPGAKKTARTHGPVRKAA